MRFFNTEGPIRPEDHYHVPPLDRVNVDELLGLIRDKKYFVREDVAEGMRAVLSELALEASVTLGDETLEGIWPGVLDRAGPGQALRQALLRWCMADARPLVLLLDEIDALVGDTLLSVLRQLRAGYPGRPARFPQSVVVCGVRDVRDYRIHSTAQNALVLGGSAFNVKAKSLRLAC